MGSMARRIRDGRRIDRWNFTNVDGVKFAIDVYLVTALRRDNVCSSFRAICDEFAIDEDDTDIDALRKKVREKAESAVVEHIWADHFLVTFDGVREDERTALDETADDNSVLHSVAISLSIREVALSGDSDDPDSQKHRDFNWGKQKVSGGWPWTEKDVEGGEATALVPDTPENRAALRAIVEGFEKLSARLVELMGPERIEETLAAATGARLLGSGEPKEAPAPRVRSRTRKR